MLGKNMREHICIRNSDYVAGTAEKPEVGVFTQARKNQRPSPWGRIAEGETVWMKWSGGPIVAKAEVSGFRQISDCTPEKLKSAVSGYALHQLTSYWDSLNGTFNALVVYLEREEWLDEPLDVLGRSYGSSWVVLENREAVKNWMSQPPIETKQAKDPRGSRTARPRLRFEVFRRDSYTCQYCGRSAPEYPLHVDHIIAWSNGGSTEISNLIKACIEFKLGKSNKKA
jgi:5-methylcytosine-specific restriction endonuclease McrA